MLRERLQRRLGRIRVFARLLQAATLAGEAGMYQEPEERYGRLVMDAFLTSRLVVGTGMNRLGWSVRPAGTGVGV